MGIPKRRTLSVLAILRFYGDTWFSTSLSMSAKINLMLSFLCRLTDCNFFVHMNDVHRQRKQLTDGVNNENPTLHVCVIKEIYCPTLRLCSLRERDRSSIDKFNNSINGSFQNDSVKTEILLSRDSLTPMFGSMVQRVIGCHAPAFAGRLNKVDFPVPAISWPSASLLNPSPSGFKGNP